MQSIYIWMMISIGLGGIGFLISFTRALKERRKVLDSLPGETAESILEDKKSPREELSGVTLVFAFVAVPAFIYTVLGSILVGVFGVTTEAQARVAAGALMALGLSSFFANVGRSRIYEETMNGLNEWDEGSQKDFGRYMIFLVLYENPVIFGLLICLFGIIFGGLMGGDIGLTMQTADEYVKGALIMGFSTASALLMSWMFNRVEGPLNEDIGLFQKKLIFMEITHTPMVIGLLIAVLMMIFSGMM
ncbi:MAG: hypothetical protein ACOCTK_02000 [Candidatus Saliniplasma sp.]